MDAMAVTPAEPAQAEAALTLGFSDDPVTRWTFPNAHTYFAHFPAFTRAFGGRAFAHGSADQVGAGAGAALWLPPRVGPDGAALVAILERVASREVLAQADAMFERMASYHPREPHWYLPLIAVDPAHRRKGYGAALLRHGLARCDRDGVPAYLESTNRANIKLYERHGFVVQGTIQVGAAPPLFPMLRAARGRA
jgi:ribosomal protein S18 acetylase RimI-like enzyme